MTWPHHIESSESIQGDDSSDAESVRDVYGRKYVNKFENADGVYLLQNDTDTIHTFFKTPGVDSANALRKFLTTYLPAELVADEYGCFVPIAEVNPDHLPKLQVQLWLSESDRSGKQPLSALNGNWRPQVRAHAVQRQSSTTITSAQKTAATEDLLRIASHVTLITELLQANHIFIHSKKAKGVCELSFCSSRSNNGSLTSPLINIEPLIHWGTVTPATDIFPCPTRIQLFRRDGEKCDDPLWAEAINKLTPQHPLSYCLECLGMVMEKRSIALQAVQKQKPPSFTAVHSASMFKPQGRLVKPDHGFKAQYRNDDSVYKDMTSFPKEGNDEEYLGEHDPVTMLNLDGPSDSRKKSKIMPLRPGRNKYGFPIFAGPSHDGENASISDSSDSGCEKVKESAARRARNKSSFPILADARDSKEQILIRGGDASDTSNTTSSSRGDSIATEDSFTPALAKMNEGSTISVWATLNRPHSSSSAQPLSRNHHCPGARPSSTVESQETPQSRPFIPPQSTNRHFGREIDTNVPSAVTAPGKRGLMMDTSKTNKTARTDVRDFLAKFSKGPTGQMSTCPPSDDTSSSLEPKSSDSCETTIFESPLNYNHHEDENDDETVPAQITPLKSSSPKSSPPSIRPTISLPTRKVSPSSKSPLGPFFAKFDTLTPPDPSLISPSAFAAHLTRVPSPSETICSCRLPCSSSTLAQCSNPSCVFGWLHYDCLDKNGKLSARHGRLVCQHCKNVREFDGRDDVGAMVGREVEFKWTGQEVLAAMPGVGEIMGVVDPYGIGSMGRGMAREEEMEEAGGNDDGGALGALGFMGYVESRPGVVGEAYLEPGKYAERVRRMVTEEQEREVEEMDWDEEGYEGWDEEYGYEDEEEEGVRVGDGDDKEGNDGENSEEMKVNE